VRPRKDGRRIELGDVRTSLFAKSFVPPRPLRDLRDLLRYRRKLVESQASERNRLLKLVETANIKLASVASDGSERWVAGFKSDSRPASDRNRWPALYCNAWPASSPESAGNAGANGVRASGSFSGSSSHSHAVAR
jgi:hypothetical protein